MPSLTEGNIKYTEAEHAMNLLRMLEDPNPCDLCPVGLKRPCAPEDERCRVCHEFIRMWTTQTSVFTLREICFGRFAPCPCRYYGEREAIKRTWLALEAKGYLD